MNSHSKIANKKNKYNKNDEQTFELNKLEAHLLKLTIPFVRIAHCPRGAYFKVKGSLIMISADISQSLSRILPQEQNILPVCFKRKLEYKGNYLEETIDKAKVQAYFDFYKENNPLYKDVQFTADFVDQFETECMKEAENFEEKLDEMKEKSPMKTRNEKSKA